VIRNTGIRWESALRQLASSNDLLKTRDGATVIVTALRSGSPEKIDAILEQLDLPASGKINPAALYTWREDNRMPGRAEDDALTALRNSHGERYGKLGHRALRRSEVGNAGWNVLAGDLPAAVLRLVATLRDIAALKMADLSAHDIEAAARMIEGTARSMGIEVEAAVKR
jgi:hypothetical protein